jgi:hypothetical protein
MAKFNTARKVGPHGALEWLDDRLATVAGEIVMPLGRFPRRMTVAGLASGGTAIWSAIPLGETEMREIEALGPPELLIVPGVGHRLDARPWLDRYPAMKVVCAPGAMIAVEEVVPVAATTITDPEVTFETLPGVGKREAALLVRREGRLTLVLNDVLANVRHPHGLGAQIMARVMGFGVNRPQVPWLGKRMFVEEATDLAAAFRGWAADPALARIVVSHGDVIGYDPRGALDAAAKSLGG